MGDRVLTEDFYRFEQPRQTPNGVAWEAVGMMPGAYRIARGYAVKREQFRGGSG